MDVSIPFLGDGIDTANVLSVLVNSGDTVTKDQTILELETDKAVAPVPSPEDGVISTIYLNEGDKVSQGTKVCELQTSGSDSSSDAAAPAAQASPVTPVVAPVAAAPTNVAVPAAPTPQPTVQVQALSPAELQATLDSVAAPPSIKKIALAIGLDLRLIQGTGNAGRITHDDVRNYVQSIQHTAHQAPAATQVASPASVTGPAIPDDVDYSKWGPVDAQPFSSLRQKISTKLQESWNRIPQVTQFDDCDITHLMALRKKYKAKFEKKGSKLTLTVFVMEALNHALKKYPEFNSSYNEVAQELVYKQYYHLSIAVDTEAGLMVPVIRDANTKSLLNLSEELQDIAQKARDRSLGVADLQGGTFTISNLGGLGVGGFTPLVNAPQVGILGIGKGDKKLYLDKKTVKEKLVMPLALSYDHRVIDGANGARFLKEVVDYLEQFPEKSLKESL